MIGTLIGGTLKGAWLGAKTAYKVSGPAMSAAFKVATPAAKVGLTTAGRAAGFAMRHPQAAMTLGVASLGVYGLAKTGANTSDMSADEANRLASLYGPSTGFTPGTGSMAYDPRRMRFHDSTNGLVQGLHRGRH